MYQEHMMSDNTTNEQRAKIQAKMINEWIIDETKYSNPIKNTINEQNKDVDFEINKLVEEQTSNFRDILKAKVEPYVANSTNHYQIDAYTNAIDKLMKQFEITYNNIEQTYDDTRNTQIIWL